MGVPKGLVIITEIFFGLIFIAGLLNVVNPRIIWRIFESWKATREPTAAFFMKRRVEGILMMLVVLFIFLFPYIMSKQ